jgi:hypothetical protein
MARVTAGDPCVEREPLAPQPERIAAAVQISASTV